MLGWFYILLSIIVGWSIIRLLDFSLRRVEALAMSVAVGFSLSAWITFVCALCIGFQNGLPLSLAILTTICLSIFFIKQKVSLHGKTISGKGKYIGWIIALSTGFVVIRLLFMSYQFPTLEGDWKSNGNAWGDAPIHITYINQFSQGDKVDLVSPSYMKVPLTYPFMADFYSSILKRLGSDWTFVLLAPSILMMASLLYLVYSFGYRILGSARGAWLQYLLLVFCGSLQGGWKLTQVLFNGGIDAYDKLVGVSIAFAAGDNYLNFIHSHPIPQRSYLFGMPLFITGAVILLEQYRKRTKQAGLSIPYINAAKEQQLPKFSSLIRHIFTPAAIPLGIIIGMFPLVHVHSLFVLIGILGLSLIGLSALRKPIPYQWVGGLLIGAILALPQLIWQFRSTYNSQFTKWIAGWTMKGFVLDPSIDFVSFWIGCLGFLFFVIIFGWIWLKKLKAPNHIWLLYIAGVGIFAVCNIYVFQPSVWDNMKFFMYGFWFEMIVASYILTKWWQNWKLRFIIVPIIVTLITMGFYTLVLSGPKLNFELLSKDEVAFGENMQQTLPADAFVLVTGRHNHPITMLSNRKVVITYEGWYNLYDGKWTTVARDRSTMLTGSQNAAELISQYGVTHAIFSDYEVIEGLANLAYYQQHYALVTHESGWWVFDTKEYYESR